MVCRRYNVKQINLNETALIINQISRLKSLKWIKFSSNLSSQCCDGILGSLQNIDVASMTQKVKINVKKVANKQRDMIAVF